MSSDAVARNLDSPLLSVVMPAYNERATIEEIIRRVTAVAIDMELIIVDDFSKDGTREYLQQLSRCDSFARAQEGTRPQESKGPRSLKVLFQDRNYGKGAALRRGFGAATGEIIVIQDADLELDPQEYGKLIKPILDNEADVVYGSRFLQAASGVSDTPNYWGNRALTAFSNLFTGLHLTDVWTGYKTFRRKILDSVEFRENRFAFEPEFTAKIARQSWRVSEVPVTYSFRTLKDGKKISWKDGFRGLACTFYYGSACLLKVDRRAIVPRVELESVPHAIHEPQTVLDGN